MRRRRAQVRCSEWKRKRTLIPILVTMLKSTRRVLDEGFVADKRGTISIEIKGFEGEKNV